MRSACPAPFWTLNLDGVSGMYTLLDAMSRLSVHGIPRPPHPAVPHGEDARADHRRGTRPARRGDVPRVDRGAGRRPGRCLARDALPALPLAGGPDRRDVHRLRREPGAAHGARRRRAARRGRGARADDREHRRVLVVGGRRPAPALRRRGGRPRGAAPRRAAAQRPALRTRAPRRNAAARAPPGRSGQARTHDAAPPHELRQLPGAARGGPLRPAGGRVPAGVGADAPARCHTPRVTEFPSFRVDGQVALVTGAARGLGRAIALALADAGADVALGLRDPASAGDLAAEIEALGRRALRLPMDVSVLAQVRAAVTRTAEELGSLDILVNNAGIAPGHLATDVPEDDFDRTLAINLKGTFFASQAAA